MVWFYMFLAYVCPSERTRGQYMCKVANKSVKNRPVVRGILLKTTKYHYQKALIAECDTCRTTASRPPQRFANSQNVRNFVTH